MGISYLIDTHVLLWWVFDDPKLSSESRDILKNPLNHILISSATAWEIATKHQIGKLPEAGPLLKDYHGLLAQMGFSNLPITPDHALRAGSLISSHRDPFDRMLIAQAELENLPIITYDPALWLDHLQVIPRPGK